MLPHQQNTNRVLHCECPKKGQREYYSTHMLPRLPSRISLNSSEVSSTCVKTPGAGRENYVRFGPRFSDFPLQSYNVTFFASLPSKSDPRTPLSLSFGAHPSVTRYFHRRQPMVGHCLLRRWEAHLHAAGGVSPRRRSAWMHPRVEMVV